MADDNASQETPTDSSPEGTAETFAEITQESSEAVSTARYSWAKKAGIITGTVLACAVIVVATVWAIDAIVSKDDYYGPHLFEPAAKPEVMVFVVPSGGTASGGTVPDKQGFFVPDKHGFFSGFKGEVAPEFGGFDALEMVEQWLTGQGVTVVKWLLELFEPLLMELTSEDSLRFGQ